MSAGMVDKIIRAEANLERRAMALAITWPKTMAQKIENWTPQVDLISINYFKRFREKIKAINAADHGTSISIALECCTVGEWLECFRYIDNINTYEAIDSIIEEILTARTARKALRWVEQSRILEIDGVNYG
jgi:hypothetical protein